MYASAQEALAIIHDASKTISLSEKRLKPTLVELKTLKNPPNTVKTVIEVLCIILNVRPGSKPDVMNPGKFTQDYWVSGRKLLADANGLTEKILNLDKYNLTQTKLNSIKKYLNKEELDYDRVRKISSAAATIVAWVRGVYGYGTAMTYLGAEHPTILEKEERLNSEQDSKVLYQTNSSPAPALQNNQMQTPKRKPLRPQTVPTKSIFFSRNNMSLLQTNNQRTRKSLNDPIIQRERARLSANLVTKYDILELRTMIKPPNMVLDVWKIIAFLLEEPAENYGLKGMRFCMRDSERFLNRLVNFDKDSIPENMVGKMRCFVNNDKFSCENVMKVNLALASLVNWMRNIWDYWCASQDLGSDAKLVGKNSSKFSRKDLRLNRSKNYATTFKNFRYY